MATLARRARPRTWQRRWSVLCTVALAAASTISPTPAGSTELPRDCVKQPLDIVVDVGHGQRAFGATSARGAREFDFNLRFATELVEAAVRDLRLRLRLLSPTRYDLALGERVVMANAAKPDLMISIHHDSAHPSLLEPWVHDGKTYRISRQIAGFSIFVSRSNPQYATALRYAEAIGSAWRAAGHKPTLHHAADLEGERRRLLRPDIGVYLAPFAVIDRTRVPALLLEVGVLINPDEETWLLDPANRHILQGALLAALAGAGCRPVDPRLEEARQ